MKVTSTQSLNSRNEVDITVRDTRKARGQLGLGGSQCGSDDAHLGRTQIETVSRGDGFGRERPAPAARPSARRQTSSARPAGSRARAELLSGVGARVAPRRHSVCNPASLPLLCGAHARGEGLAEEGCAYDVCPSALHARCMSRLTLWCAVAASTAHEFAHTVERRRHLQITATRAAPSAI